MTALCWIDWHDPPRYDKWLYTRDESVITSKNVRVRKMRECTDIHGYMGGTSWRGRVNAVRPCHDTATRTRVWNIVVLRGEEAGKDDGNWWEKERERERVLGSEFARSWLSQSKIKTRREAISRWHSIKFKRFNCINSERKKDIRCRI